MRLAAGHVGAAGPAWAPGCTDSTLRTIPAPLGVGQQCLPVRLWLVLRLLLLLWLCLRLLRLMLLQLRLLLVHADWICGGWQPAYSVSVGLTGPFTYPSW